MVWRIGVDIGGTFTDVALVDDASGRIGVAKVPTTPADLTAGVLAALETAMGRYRVAAAEVGLLSHATTVVTNAILEARGARAALIGSPVLSTASYMSPHASGSPGNACPMVFPTTPLTPECAAKAGLAST
jgi:N-methylhydantoinase A